MPLDIASRVKSPETRWFHLVDDGSGLEIVENEADADLSLKLRYISERERQKYWEAATRRKPATKKGLKQLVSEEGVVSRRIATDALLDWKLTVAGAYVLRAKLDLADCKPDEVILFEPKARDTMIEHSDLAVQVTILLNRHEAWYDAPGSPHDEGEVGNSSNGQSTNTAKPPAETASKATARHTSQATT